MAKIQLNGKSIKINRNSCIKDLIKIKDKDNVEIVQFIGGG